MSTTTSKPLKPKRGTTAQNKNYTGEAYEVTLDTDKKTLVVHDGLTAGGFPLAKEADLTALTTTQAAKDAAQDAAIAEALDKVGLPLGFEYTRLTGQNAPLGGVDYMGQTATRAMYADLFAWQRKNKPESFVTEARWQELFASQNGNVPFYSEGDGSTTFRFPRVVGYFKGAGSVDELGQYTKEGLPGHTHTRGTMEITGEITSDPYAGAFRMSPNSMAVSGAFSSTTTSESYAGWNSYSGQHISSLRFNASRSWTGETSQPTNPIYGNSQHVTPETVTVVMGVIAFGSVASIGEATEEGIVAELGEHGAKLGEHGAKLGELEAAIEAFHDNCVGEIFSWPADSEPYRALPINGAAVSRTTYAKLFAKIGTKYGAGDGSTTFNVPNGIGKFLQCDNTAGTVKVAGLPDITGNLNGLHDVGVFDAEHTGCFYAGTITNRYARSATSATAYLDANFRASGSNSIYGASTTVQPPALTMRYYIKY